MTLTSVLLAGGGSAGHVEPALALAEALRQRHPHVTITMLGTATGLEARLVPANGYPLAEIPRVPLPRKPGKDLLTVPLRANKAVSAAVDVIDQVRPQVVVGFGGFVAFPAYLAARRRGVPIVVHEANPLPGVANRVGSRLTPYVAISTRGTPLPNAVLTGIPVRRRILTLDRAARRAGARQTFGLDPNRFTLLVFGGSQGARRINEAVSRAAGALSGAGVQVLHATGAAHADSVRAELARTAPAAGGTRPDVPYVVVPYLDDMGAAYAAADFAVCRCGAMTCAELAAVGLPAVYVPFPIGNGEQRLNARPAVDAGAALLVDDADLTPAWITTTLVPLLADPLRVSSMAAQARQGGFPRAAQDLAELVERAAATGPRHRAGSGR